MSNLIDNRQIRVFISSTFQDMQNERDYLMTKTFPLLRKAAAERDVTLTEVDLRWGIQEEESKSGKVVEICLREIENSIPFFIGIIGNRYGWIPERDEIDQDSPGMERYKEWVQPCLDKKLSVTELEIQYGVLQRKEDVNAFFYIYSQKDVSSDNEEKLSNLKNAIMQSRYPVAEYSTKEELGQKVERSFLQLLDKLFPIGQLSELEKERISQRSFLNALSTTYVKNVDDFNVLDAFLSDDKQQYLVITGESGLGKSALIANWIKEKAQFCDNYKVVYHFVGNGGSIGSHLHLLKCLVDEICDQYNLQKPEGKADDEALKELLDFVSISGTPMLIAIDAINQILDVDNAKILGWLPVLPKNIKLLFSTLSDDKTMEVFQRRGYPIFVLKPLSESRRRLLVDNYLHAFGKRLSEKQVNRIVSNPQCSNTLVLKTLLDELVGFGFFEKLDERIDFYLSVNDIGEFYQKMLERYESDFGAKLVSETLSLIAVSREGLSESEIMTITGMLPLHWSQFFCAFSSHLNVKNGLVSFSHNYITKAVENKYLIGHKDNENDCRRKLVSYFNSESSFHARNELPYQYDLIEDNEGLHSYFIAADKLSYWVNERLLEFAKYWRKLLACDKGYSIYDYLAVKGAYVDEIQFYIDLMEMCDVLSDIIKKKELAQELLEYYKKNNIEIPPRIYRIMAGCMGQPYFHDFGLEAVKCSLKKYGMYHKETMDSYGTLGAAYYDLLCIHNREDCAPKAFEAWSKSNDIAEKMYGHNCQIVAGNLRAMGLVCDESLEKALELEKESLKISLSLFGEKHPDTGWSYNHLGCIYRELKQFDIALDCFQKSFACWYPAYGENHHLVAASMGNQAHALRNLGRKAEAIPLMLRAMNVRRIVEGQEKVEYINQIGITYSDIGEYDKAIEYLERGLALAKKLNDEEKTRKTEEEITRVKKLKN